MSDFSSLKVSIFKDVLLKFVKNMQKKRKFINMEYAQELRKRKLALKKEKSSFACSLLVFFVNSPSKKLYVNKYFRLQNGVSFLDEVFVLNQVLTEKAMNYKIYHRF